MIMHAVRSCWKQSAVQRNLLSVSTEARQQPVEPGVRHGKPITKKMIYKQSFKKACI